MTERREQPREQIGVRRIDYFIVALSIAISVWAVGEAVSRGFL